MSDDTTPIARTPEPSDGEPAAAAEASESRSMAEGSSGAILKALVAVLLVAVLALSGWALSMSAQLGEKDEQIAELTGANASLEAESTAAGSALAEELAQAQDDVTTAVGALGLTQEELDVKENQVRAAVSELEKAKDREDKAQGRLEEAEAERDLNLAQRNIALLCSQGALSALSLAYGTDDIGENVEASLAELEKAQAACREAGRF